MRFDKVILAGLVASGLLISTAGPRAQEQAPPTPPASPVPQAPPGTILVPDSASPVAAALPGAADRTPEQNWLKVCDALESGERACIMRQIIIKGGQFTGSFVLRDDPGQENRLLAVAAVPLGVLLPFGLTWQIDGAKPLRVPYMVCDPNSCVSQLVINEAYVDSLKRGARLALTARNRQNEDLVIEVNLSGFTAVWENAEALTIDEFQAQESGQAALEKLLQDRAEQIRLEREGAAAAPPPAQ
ncbi:MAG TPA: invasion associated locus B family protein [Devosiaceae bacterium]|nr:invasion associated locus B family protein [Devosiaceae bacterium]